jgi:hypothetical protein
MSRDLYGMPLGDGAPEDIEYEPGTPDTSEAEAHYVHEFAADIAADLADQNVALLEARGFKQLAKMIQALRDAVENCSPPRGEWRWCAKKEGAK